RTTYTAHSPDSDCTAGSNSQPGRSAHRQVATVPPSRPGGKPAACQTRTQSHRFSLAPPTQPAPKPPPANVSTPTTGSAATASRTPEVSPCAPGGPLHHIGVGRSHARTHALMPIQDLDVRIINAATGGLSRQLTVDPMQ